MCHEDFAAANHRKYFNADAISNARLSIYIAASLNDDDFRHGLILLLFKNRPHYKYG